MTTLQKVLDVLAWLRTNGGADPAIIKAVDMLEDVRADLESQAEPVEGSGVADVSAEPIVTPLP